MGRGLTLPLLSGGAAGRSGRYAPPPTCSGWGAQGVGAPRVALQLLSGSGGGGSGAPSARGNGAPPPQQQQPQHAGGAQVSVWASTAALGGAAPGVGAGARGGGTTRPPSPWAAAPGGCGSQRGPGAGEGGERCASVVGLSWHPVRSAAGAAALLREGSRHRAVRATDTAAA
jgi:hypothetical protein